VVVVVVVINGSGRGGSHNRPGEGSKPEEALTGLHRKIASLAQVSAMELNKRKERNEPRDDDDDDDVSDNAGSSIRRSQLKNKN
jgi:hypothetical protein